MTAGGQASDNQPMTALGHAMPGLAGQFFACFLAGAVSGAAQVDGNLPASREPSTRGGPPQTGNRGREGDRVYKTRVEPHWFGDNHRFWYRNDLQGGTREFVLVDVARGTRKPAFDHEAVAEAMGDGAEADRLPIRRLRFADDGASVRLIGPTQTWRLNRTDGRLEALSPAEAGSIAGEDRQGLRAEADPRPSARTGPETWIRFDNRLDRTVEVFWLESGGGRQSYGRVAAGELLDQHTFAGHRWLAAELSGEQLAVFEATEDGGVAVLDGKPPRKPDRIPRQDRSRHPRPSDRRRSPDGAREAFIQDSNLWIRPADEAGEAVPLCRDGTPDHPYVRLTWSPDSTTVVAWRKEPAERKDVYLIRSSPPDGGRATFEQRPYALPGDPFPRYDLQLFDVESGSHVSPAIDPFEHEWATPEPHWWPGTTRFVFTQVDRGHQRYRIFEVDTSSGSVRILVDERSETFIWTAHRKGVGQVGLPLVTFLDQSREILYLSERNGWRHLYLVDADGGGITKPITRGDWVVRGIDRIDEEQRELWFQAGGRNPGQDPYLLHSYRVRFDGSGLTALTEGNGQHRVTYSPDRTYLIDTYSRVDLPPVTELRRTADGSLVCELERADISELTGQGWRAPEVFSAKGRDGKTDIWGIIVRPASLDPDRRYPIIEDIYAGPHGSFVPKTFSPTRRYRDLTDAGFVVVKIDGMGTANRSKAFQDLCFQNLRDAGFEDRIRWMKAAAQQYPYLDVDRVGIYGTSAGGQNAGAAVLFHPEFYKAAAANCGCHDNRMDKASWNEQWMGFMPGDQIWSDAPDNPYARNSNIVHAGNLRGALLLCVGEVDTNVPPESTLRLVDALIRADKDFELLVVPNGGHGAGGAYYRRRMVAFFVRHLQGGGPG